MKFWDSSAILPLLVREPQSERVKTWLAADPSLVVWWGSRAECWSALARLRREEVITAAQESAIHRRLEVLAVTWVEVQPSAVVMEHARRLLRTHTLRAADALQLAAALVWREGGGGSGEFVTFDARLALCAELEGWALLQ